MRTLLFIAITSLIAYSSGHSQTLPQQIECAKIAQKTFKRWETGKQRKAELNFDHYESHYNTRLNRCLMLTTIFTKEGIVIDMGDPIERRDYATYIAKMTGTILACQLTPSYDKSIFCKSKKEFNAFVAQYMDQ